MLHGQPVLTSDSRVGSARASHRRAKAAVGLRLRAIWASIQSRPWSQNAGVVSHPRRSASCSQAAHQRSASSGDCPIRIWWSRHSARLTTESRSARLMATSQCPAGHSGPPPNCLPYILWASSKCLQPVVRCRRAQAASSFRVASGLRLAARIRREVGRPRPEAPRPQMTRGGRPQADAPRRAIDPKLGLLRNGGACI